VHRVGKGESGRPGQHCRKKGREKRGKSEAHVHVLGVGHALRETRHDVVCANGGEECQRREEEKNVELRKFEGWKVKSLKPLVAAGEPPSSSKSPLPLPSAQILPATTSLERIEDADLLPLRRKEETGVRREVTQLEALSPSACSARQSS
jgi:hypothetical protein